MSGWSIILTTLFLGRLSPKGGACWSVLYQCVNKKPMRKGTFFQAGQCAVLSSFRVGICYFLLKKGYVFHKLAKTL